MTWRPISTAPKDGTRIIVYRPVSGPMIPHVGEDYWAAFSHGDTWGQSNGDTLPALWQPLPGPPEEAP